MKTDEPIIPPRGNYTWKRILLLIALPMLVLVTFMMLLKLLAQTESDDVMTVLVAIVIVSGMGLVIAFPFLLMFALIMERIRALGWLKNKWVCFAYGGSAGMFTFWISTVLDIWFIQQKSDMASAKMLLLMFFVHAFVALFVYRRELPADPQKEVLG